MRVVCTNNIFPREFKPFDFTIGKSYEFKFGISRDYDDHSYDGTIKDNNGVSFHILSRDISPWFRPIEEIREERLNSILG